MATHGAVFIHPGGGDYLLSGRPPPFAIHLLISDFRNRQLPVLLRQETGLPVTLADDPLTAVVTGGGKVLDEPLLLRDVTVD